MYNVLSNLQTRVNKINVEMCMAISNAPLILHAVDDDRRVACLVLPVQHVFEKFEH